MDCLLVVVVVLLLQSSSLAISSSSNITDQEALLAFNSSIKIDPNNTLQSNWTEKSNFCDWVGVSCSRRRQRVTALILPRLGLQGTISPHIGNLSFLVRLDLRRNSFYGHLPREIFRLHRLTGLILEHNMLEGSIPPGLHQCPKLKFLSLAVNRLTGSIPKELSTLPLLITLYLGRNNLTGTIPPSLFANTSSIKYFALDSNHLHGNIPAGILRHSNLELINLNANQLSGFIPPETFNISSLYDITLSGNELSGELPSTTGLWLPNLGLFRVAGNRLTGNIPSYLSNSSNLAEFDLCWNLLSGKIPTSLGQLPSLETILLYDNQLTGPIPQEIGFLANLTDLVLHDNRLTGTIPSSIGGMQSLQRLYLDSNKLHGFIPNEICLLRNLGEMSLDNNTLSGSIPDCIGNLSNNLKVLSLSSNTLNSIPSSLWNLEYLLYLDLRRNSLGGSLESNIRALKVLETMDLSWNQISGNIPSTIGDLKSLTALNLSGNSFSGPIPDSMGNLIALDFLDLSHNNLSGAIPKSLEHVPYLKYLNLSFNKLTGMIPSGGPFANLTAQSFTENEALCGKPIFQVPPCPLIHTPNKKKSLRLLKILLPALVASMVILVSFLYILKRYHHHQKKIKARSQHPVDPFPTNAIEHRLVSYHELRHATNGFCEANLVGVGSFGSVYRGILVDGTSIAVKVLNLEVEGAFKSFDAECKVLRTARHRNLVKVISTCSNPDLRALIMQYMSSGSLENWLHSPNTCQLDLLQRTSIMLDVALALEYLHHGLSEAVVHCDLKPSNVLLDEDMVAHVSDFGIAKILAGKKNATQTKAIGTLGYIAPEYGYEGRVSTKGDMYSYGIMLLETFTRKKPTDEMFTDELSFRQWVNASLPTRIVEVVDDRLITSIEEDGRKMIDQQSNLVAIMELGLECSKESPEERSDIKQVVIKLNKIKLHVLQNRGY